MEAIQRAKINIFGVQPIDFKFGMSNFKPTINKAIKGIPTAKNTMVSKAQKGI